MLNERVIHKKFGPGVLTKFEATHIEVTFDKYPLSKIFVYPDVFESFMSFENSELQKQTVQILNEKKERKLQEALERQQKYREIAQQRKRERLAALRKQRKTIKSSKPKNSKRELVVK